MKRKGRDRKGLIFKGDLVICFWLGEVRVLLSLVILPMMTRELSLLQWFRANKTNLLECEISQKETVPEGHRRGGHLTGHSFQAPGLGLESRLGSRKGLLRWGICMRVCLLTGMCWCNELLIRSARCFTPRSCAPASEGPSHPQVRITVLEPFPACPGRPRYPGMPSAASLSQHALGGLAIPACPRAALASALAPFLLGLYLLSYVLSLFSLSLLYHFPKHLSLAQNIILEAGVY